MEQRLFAHPAPVSVPSGSRRSGIGKGLLDCRIGSVQFFTGKTVVKHQQISGEKDMLNDGNLFISIDETVFPGKRNVIPRIVPESGLDIPFGNIVRENGTDDIHPFQFPVTAHEINAPQKAECRSDRLRQPALLTDGERPFFAAEKRKGGAEQGFMRTVGRKKLTVSVVLP